MLNNILELKGVSKLNRSEQQSIIAAGPDGCSTCPGDEFYECLQSCAGTCSPNGTCYQILH
ncbi:hypothetical protein [uncultured Aquimarina sp.]|uniref:hypothetical protein n=1 Tax=uncultured Aquimarina sp. TaxID=575652 RepID=UPI002610E71D|nr:hypothetical protein [uncultured Aquimarina sp.]